MSSKRKLFLAFTFISFILIFSASMSFSAQGVNWTSTGGPQTTYFGLGVIDVEVDPTDGDRMWVLCSYSSDAYKLFGSSDRGETFTEIIPAEESWVYFDGYMDRKYIMFGIEYDPRNGRLYAFGGSDSSNYYGCVFVSPDEGETWSQIYGYSSSAPVEWTYTDRFAISPVNENYLFRGMMKHSNIEPVQGRIMSISKDGGISWTDIASGMDPEDLPWRAGAAYIAPHPTNESVVAVNVVYENRLVYTPTREAGIFISTNECASFFRVLTDRPKGSLASSSGRNMDERIVAVEFDPANPRTIRAVRSGSNYYDWLWGKSIYVTPEVLVSTNEGAVWTTIEAEEIYVVSGELTNLNRVFTDPNDFDRIFYLTFYSGIWATDDGGHNWARIQDDQDNYVLSGAIEFSSSESGVVYFCLGISPILRRANNWGGVSSQWENLSDQLRARASSFYIYDSPLSPGVIFSSPGQGFRSDNYGNAWAETGPNLWDFTDFDPLTEGGCYSSSYRTLVRTINNWTTSETVYTHAATDEGIQMIKIHPTETATLYASITSGGNPRIIKSTDSGVNWSTWGPTGTGEAPGVLVINPVSPEVMYKANKARGRRGGSIGNPIGNVYGIKKSSDGGQSWSDITPGGFSEMATVSAVAIDPKNPERIFVGAGNRDHKGRAYWSTDGGGSWNIFGDPPSSMVNTFVQDIIVDPVRPERVYALFYPINGSTDDSIFARKVIGVDSNWVNISSDIKDQFGNLLEINGIDLDHKTDMILYASTNKGVWRGYDLYLPLPPTIEAVEPHYAVNLSITNMQISGNSFLDITRADITGPQNKEVAVLGYAPLTAAVQIPAFLLPGTYEVTVTSHGLQSNAATFEVVGASPDGPQFKWVKFDGLAYYPPSAPVPVSRSPQVIARVYDEDGINETGFGYLWTNKDTQGQRQVTYEASVFAYTPVSTVEGDVTFTIDPAWTPGNYQLVIIARDKATSEVYPEGNVGAWSGDLEVEVGPVRVIGDILTYPPVFKPLTAGEVTIAYNLSQNAGTTIFLYDISGRVVLTKKFPVGDNGGRAGYNAFNWDGISDFGGYVGNGIYVIKVTSGNKAIGTGKLVVFD